MKKLLVTFALLAAAASAQSSIDVTVGSSVVHFKKLPKSTITFGFTAGTVDAQGNATLAVSISTSRMPPAAVQFDILYPASVTAITATAGPVVTAAGKTLACSVISPGDLNCVAAGLNKNLILNGVGVNVAATINANSTLTLSGVIASNALGGALATAISQATANVAIALVLQGVVCAVPPYDSGLPAGTYNIEPGESATCTATLNQPAPAAGYAAPISASAAGLSLPAILAVSSGQTSAQFTVTGQ